MKRGIPYSLALLLAAYVAMPIAAHADGLPKKFVSSDSTEMVLIPEGAYDMGSDNEDIKLESLLHRVYVSSFYMDIHPVTNARFAEFLNKVGLKEPERRKYVVIRTDLSVKGREGWWPTEIAYERKKYVAYEGYEDYPVLTVSWDGADAYCRYYGKRLPTEAEWEKAARGGLKGKLYPWGDSMPTSAIVFARQWKSNQAPPPTGPVRNYLPNGYGLYDMAGMVWEWCQDWFDPFYFKDSPIKDPRGPATGIQKVLRGGSWFNGPMQIRTAVRNFDEFGAMTETIGFRCVADTPNKSED